MCVWGGGGGEGSICLLLHCHHQNDSCIKMGSDVSHFNVSLIVRNKVMSQDSVHQPEPFSREVRAEAESSQVSK